MNMIADFSSQALMYYHNPPQLLSQGVVIISSEFWDRKALPATYFDLRQIQWLTCKNARDTTCVDSGATVGVTSEQVGIGVCEVTAGRITYNM